jgi:hypothetical protein
MPVLQLAPGDEHIGVGLIGELVGVSKRRGHEAGEAIAGGEVLAE